MIKLINLLLVASILFSFSACSQIISGDAEAPVLERAVTDISVPKNGTITLTLEHVEAYDNNGDLLQILVFDGDNYSVSGSTVIPDSGFIGDLYVNVQVTDGVLFSRTLVVIISVVTTVEMFPLLEGAWWQYQDSIPGNDTVITSRLEVNGSVDTLIDDKSTKLFSVSWSDLDEHGVEYFMSTGDSGTIFHGGISPTDTLVNPQQLYYYPVKLGASWDYKPLKYNVSDKVFFQGSSSKIVCTDTSTYVTVPAGVFRSVELTLNYKVKNNPETAGSNAVEGDSILVTEKLYYSAGVGYVKNITLLGEKVVWLKELTSYNVIEATEGDN